MELEDVREEEDESLLHRLIMLRLYGHWWGHFWNTVSSSNRKDITKVDRVWKRFTRMLLGMEGLRYKERLDRLRLFSLQHRRLRIDLIEIYKITRGMDRMNGRCLFHWVGDFKTSEHIFKKLHIFELAGLQQMVTHRALEGVRDGEGMALEMTFTPMDLMDSTYGQINVVEHVFTTRPTGESVAEHIFTTGYTGGCEVSYIKLKSRSGLPFSSSFDALRPGCVARTVNSPNQHLLKADDVISCCLDLSAPSISFRINGQPVQGMFENFNTDGLFFPVVSFSTGVKALDTTKAMGPDNILIIALKPCTPELVGPLVKLFQYSYTIGNHLTMWKIAQFGVGGMFGQAGSVPSTNVTVIHARDGVEYIPFGAMRFQTNVWNFLLRS
eukprot:g48061.t1